MQPLGAFESSVVDQRVEKDMSLDIFEMTTNTNEPTMELVNIQLLIYKRYQVDVKTSNVHCYGGKNVKTCFLQLVFVLEKS